MKFRYIQGSENTSEAVEFDIRKPNGDYVTTCVVNIRIFIAGIKTFPCGNGDDVTLTGAQCLEVLNAAKEGREALISGTIKTYDGWHKSGVGTFEDYVQPGDEVDEAFVDYFVNVLPPTTCRGDLVQGGEPYCDAPDTGGRWRSTYITFAKTGGVWCFAGYCFVGGRENRVEQESGIERLIRIVSDGPKGGVN